MTYALGVDLGTSRTAAAVWRDGRATTVGLADTSDTIPSAVFLLPDGGLLVGDAALRRGVLQPDRLARGFKRRLGDPAKMLLGDESIAVPELTGHLLRHVLDVVTAREGGPPAHVVLTVPATWGDHHRALMTAVAEQAQLRDVGLLPEPVAVAVHHAALARLDVGAVAAVYDLGGGTFDTAVVQRTADGYELRGRPGGDEGVGGEDFDDVVVQHVQRNLGAALLVLDPDDDAVRAGLAAVRQHAIAAKEALSHDVEATIPVILPGITREVRLTRGELETALRIPLLRTVDALDRTIASSGVPRSDIAAVLLAGGSSRIPLVSQLVVSELGLAVATDAHPKYATALGAALAGAARVAPPVRRPPPPVAPPPVLAVPDPVAAQPFPDADLLAPAPVATPPPLQVDPADVGVLGPTDDALTVTGRLPGRLRHLSAHDELVVEHRADRRRGGLVAGAALLVVLLLAGGVGLAAATGVLGGDDPVVGPPTRSTSSSPTPTPDDTAAGPPVLLTAQTVTAGAPGDVLRAAGATGVGLMGVGSTADPVDGASAAASVRIWLSSAGTWTPVAAPVTAGASASGATSVVAAPSGAAVVGGWVSAGTGSPEERSARRGRIWVSGDGRSWTAATVPDVGEITDVATGPAGLVATALAVPSDGSGDVDAVVLTSPDGAVWTQAQTSGLDGPAPLVLAGLLVDGSGLLALGTGLEGAEDVTRVWSSPDGLAWTPGAALTGTGPGGATGRDLVRTADGTLLAVGSQVGVDGLPAGLVWTGSGDAWAPRAADVAGVRLFGASAGPDGVLVVGTTTGADGATAPGAWSAALG